MKRLGWIALFLVICVNAWSVTLPYTFSTTVPPSWLNANFSALRDAINLHESTPNPHSTTLQQVLAVDNEAGIYDIDFDLNQAENMRVHNVNSDPVCNAGSAGQLIWNASTSLFKICDGGAFAVVSATSSGVVSFAQEVPAGAINGINLVYTISQTPTANSFKLYLDGLRLRETLHYTISGATITMVTAPAIGQLLDCDYAY